MTGLVIKLKPNEKLLVNGVIMQNCDRAAKLRVRSSNVSILRARDAIRPETANTPLRRIYYIAQLALAGDANVIEASEQILNGIAPLRGVFTGNDLEELERAAEAAKCHKFFVVMRAIKKLFDVETALFKQADAS